MDVQMRAHARMRVRHEREHAHAQVATKSEDPPDPSCVHCVPRSWVEPAPELAKMIWSGDSSAARACPCFAFARV